MGSQQEQRPRGGTPGITFPYASLRVKPIRSPYYFSKHARLLNIKRDFWFDLIRADAAATLDSAGYVWRERAATSLWPRGPWQGKRDHPWLQSFLRMLKRPVVVGSSFHCASGQVPQAALISGHQNPHRRQRSARGQRREPGAVNQHRRCERPTFSFQSTEWVRELPGWFVAWLLLSISLEITAGGGPQPRSTHSYFTSPPLRKQRENEAERKTSPRLPPTQQ